MENTIFKKRAELEIKVIFRAMAIKLYRFSHNNLHVARLEQQFLYVNSRNKNKLRLGSAPVYYYEDNTIMLWNFNWIICFSIYITYLYYYW